MEQFFEKHASSITGTLSGLDRVRFRGTMRWLANVGGMMGFLNTVHVLLKDFDGYAIGITDGIRPAFFPLPSFGIRHFFVIGPNFQLNRRHSVVLGPGRNDHPPI